VNEEFRYGVHIHASKRPCGGEEKGEEGRRGNRISAAAHIAWPEKGRIQAPVEVGVISSFHAGVTKGGKKDPSTHTLSEW